MTADWSDCKMICYDIENVMTYNKYYSKKALICSLAGKLHRWSKNLRFRWNFCCLKCLFLHGLYRQKLHLQHWGFEVHHWKMVEVGQGQGQLSSESCIFPLISQSQTFQLPPKFERRVKIQRDENSHNLFQTTLSGCLQCYRQSHLRSKSVKRLSQGRTKSNKHSPTHYKPKSIGNSPVQSWSPRLQDKHRQFHELMAGKRSVWSRSCKLLSIFADQILDFPKSSRDYRLCMTASSNSCKKLKFDKVQLVKSLSKLTR